MIQTFSFSMICRRIDSEILLKFRLSMHVGKTQYDLEKAVRLI